MQLGCPIAPRGGVGAPRTACRLSRPGLPCRCARSPRLGRRAEWNRRNRLTFFSFPCDVRGGHKTEGLAPEQLCSRLLHDCQVTPKPIRARVSLQQLAIQVFAIGTVAGRQVFTESHDCSSRHGDVSLTVWSPTSDPAQEHGGVLAAEG